jgi:hypothetical protein
MALVVPVHDVHDPGALSPLRLPPMRRAWPSPSLHVWWADALTRNSPPPPPFPQKDSGLYPLFCLSCCPQVVAVKFVFQIPMFCLTVDAESIWHYALWFQDHCADNLSIQAESAAALKVTQPIMLFGLCVFLFVCAWRSCNPTLDLPAVVPAFAVV